MTIGSAHTVGDCVRNLPLKFGNRTDLANLADGSKSVIAVVQSIQELTETYEFEELKYQTPVPPFTPLVLTLQNPIVSLATVLATIATNGNYPQFETQNFVDVTDVFTFWMWFA